MGTVAWILAAEYYQYYLKDLIRLNSPLSHQLTRRSMATGPARPARHRVTATVTDLESDEADLEACRVVVTVLVSLGPSPRRQLASGTVSRLPGPGQAESHQSRPGSLPG